LPRAARAADFIKQNLGIEPKLEEGGRGEFSVLVGGQVVAKRGFIRFPSNKKVLEAVRLAVGV
jgi:hypothetical protein